MESARGAFKRVGARYLTFILILVHVTSFSREYRSFNVSFDVQEGPPLVVTFDPIVEAIPVTISTLCAQISCPTDISNIINVVKRRLDLKLELELEEDYMRYVQRMYKQGPSLWTDQATPALQTLRSNAHYEARALLAGVLSVRRSCMKKEKEGENQDKEETEEGSSVSDDCTFADSVKGYTRLPDSTNEMTELAKNLFNERLWAHAEALSYHVLRGNTDSAGARPIEQRDMNVLLSILAEVSAERGDLRECAHYQLRSLRLRDDENIDGNDLMIAMGRLRTILAIPALPPDYPEAQRRRNEITEDLLGFANSVRREGIQVDRYNIASYVSATPFHMAHQGLNDAPFQEALGIAFHVLSPNLYYVAERLRSGPLAPLTGDRPLRVGIVSAHLSFHPIGKMFIELIYGMATRPELEVQPFAFLVDKECHELGCVGTRDSITDLLDERLGSDFKRLPRHIGIAEEAIEDANLDVLIYGDLGMEFVTYILAHARLAQVQIAWWGHPITSGLPSIDHFFGLDWEVSRAGSEHYSEQLVRMGTMNSAPFVANPTPLISHTLLGIPQGAPFCTVLGRLFKLHPTFDLVLAHILTAVPKAYVVVVAERTYHLNQQFMNRLHVTMMDFPGTRERVVFTEFQYYNHMLNQAACVLDTFPYGGCLTTHDAVSNSVPLVTLPLEHVRGRYSLSMYSQMGHTDLVAANESHYVDIAVRLLTDVAFNEAQRVKIKEGYTTRLHRNPEVLDEWMSMLHKLTR